MTPKEIITLDGKVQIMKRYWYQIYKKGWYKHSDLWGSPLWIRFKWNKQD